MQMKHGVIAALILECILLLVCCESDSLNSNLTADETLPNYSLCVVDSFGVEYGDSLHMLGSIDDLCYHPDGSVLILDRAALRVRVLPTQGEPYFISCAGEGPGELLFPLSICSLNDGTVLVGDDMKHAVMSFSPAGAFLDEYFTTDRYVPQSMFCVDSSSIVGSMMDLEMGERIYFSFYIGRFDGDSIPSVIFTSLRWEWPAPELYTEIGLIDFAAEPGGVVFIAPDITSYTISVYDPAGDELNTIENQDVSRISKTSEEIEEEIDYFESWAREDEAYTGGYEPAPYHDLISITGVDSEGNLWVERLDIDEEHQFDIWDASGNLLYTASLQEYAEMDLRFSVDQYGILAAVVDPEHYPRILELELEMDIDE